MILATAGHIDHGKSALIRELALMTPVKHEDDRLSRPASKKPVVVNVLRYSCTGPEMER